LVKSKNPPSDEAKISDLIDIGLVDGAFLEMSESFSGNLWLTGPQPHHPFTDAMAHPQRFFTRALSL
jgi:hypothetical protein